MFVPPRYSTLLLVFAMGTAATGTRAPGTPASPGTPALPVPAPEPELPLLRLRLFDSAGLSPAVVKHLRARTEALAPGGVEIRWFLAATTSNFADASRAHVHVILWPGEPGRWNLPAETMGAVRGRGTPRVAYVFAPVVDRALARRSPRRGAAERGRAMGTALVHELVHALAPWHPHAVGGVFAGSLRPRTLVSSDARLDAHSAAALRSGLWQLDTSAGH